MSDTNELALQKAIEKRWPTASSPKVTKYIGKFWSRSRRERKITAVVEGNHGNYTVSIEAELEDNLVYVQLLHRQTWVLPSLRSIGTHVFGRAG